MFKLTIEDDEGKTTVIPVVRDEMTIGRQEGNTIRLTERNVSRRHARVVRQNGAVFIEDLASFTGVRVNGLKIAGLTQFRDGDQVQIGDYKIQLKTERAPMIDGGDRATMPTMHAIMGTTAQYGAAVPGRAAATVPMVAPADTEIPTAPLLRFPSPQNLTEIPVGSLPVPASMEGQPTIPVRRLDDPPPPPEEQVAPPARMVVLNTELAGMEFSLARPSLVIGRTDENDITLNHRSISRHHAKVVRERDHYTILDLQSANGVRVNGEDYERIELHPGDIVELGHVRVRFVGPMETFVFNARMAAGDSRFPAKAALTLVGISLAAAAVVMIQRGTRPAVVEAPPPVVEAVPPNQPALAAAPAAPAPVAAAPAPTPAAPAEPTNPADLLAKATTEAKSEDWDAALSTLEQLEKQTAQATAPPTPQLATLRREAATLRRRVEAERNAALVFAKFDQASGAKNYAEALDRYTEIPADSMYKKRARPRFEEARALFVSMHMTAAEKYRNAGKCAEAKLEADQVEKVDPRNQLVKEVVRLCKARTETPPPAVALAGARPPRPRAAGVTPASGSTTVAKTEAAPARAAAEPAVEKEKKAAEPAATEPEHDAESLIKQAREAWLRQQCGSAIDLSRKALKAKPGLIDAYQVIGVCSCSLKDAEGAGRAYAKLDDKSRSLVKALCIKHGITLGEGP